MRDNTEYLSLLYGAEGRVSLNLEFLFFNCQHIHVSIEKSAPDMIKPIIRIDIKNKSVDLNKVCKRILTEVIAFS